MRAQSELSPEKRRQKRNRFLANCFFLAPAIVLIAVYIVYPILNSLYLSMFDWNGIDPVKTFVGMGNWQALLADKVFWGAFRNNIIIVVLSIAIQLPLGMLIAVALAETKWLTRLFRTVFFLPMLMSSVAIGILFIYILDPFFGVLAGIAELFGGVAPHLLGETGTALITVILVICWQYTPFYMVLFIAALSTVSADIKEYSMIDGATSAQYYLRIAIPIIKNNIITAAVLSLIGSLKYFDLIYVLTAGGPNHATELMATYMYKTAFTSGAKGYGSTIAMALFLIVMVFSILANWLPRKLGKRGEPA